MTNRDPVWQMAYAVEFAHQLREHLRLDNWPDDTRLAELGDDAKTVADAAVEALDGPDACSVEHGRLLAQCRVALDCMSRCSDASASMMARKVLAAWEEIRAGDFDAVRKIGAAVEALGEPESQPQTSQSFPERMRAIRESKGMTQADLAKATGLQSSAISHFETGNRSPSFKNLQRIAKCLNVSIDTLVWRPKDSWIVEGLKQAKREADENPELRKRVAEHPSGLIGDPQQASAPQSRDESRDVWVDGAVASAVWLPGWQRYVPYSQLEAPAPERGGTIEALRRLDWEFVEYGACVILDRAHAEDPLGDHAAECRRNLVAIRALRKEFGL